MRRIATTLLLVALAPGSLAAQGDPVEKLRAVLTPQAAERVLERIAAARDADLPAAAMVNLALEGAAKGRSADDVLGALEGLARELGRARAALAAGGQPPAPGDVEAAATAMRMGVDGRAVAALAGSRPGGRSLAVPLLVLGGMVDGGLPSEEALAAVRERLAAGTGDAELLARMPGAAPGMGRSIRPDGVGPAMAPGLSGFQVPVAGIGVPAGPGTGPPENVPGRRPGGRPGNPSGGPPGGS